MRRILNFGSLLMAFLHGGAVSHYLPTGTVWGWVLLVATAFMVGVGWAYAADWCRRLARYLATTGL
jgi:hypothetical protein